jgi:hypothetical protein
MNEFGSITSAERSRRRASIHSCIFSELLGYHDVHAVVSVMLPQQIVYDISDGRLERRRRETIIDYNMSTWTRRRSALNIEHVILTSAIALVCIMTHSHYVTINLHSFFRGCKRIPELAALLLTLDASLSARLFQNYTSLYDLSPVIISLPFSFSLEIMHLSCTHVIRFECDERCRLLRC